MILHFCRVIWANFRADVAAVFLALMLPIGVASAASFDIVGTGQAYTLQADFNPNWNATPQGFSGAGPGTVIDIFYSANATSGQATTPMTFNTPTLSGAGLGIAGASGQMSLTYTYLGFEAAYTNQAEASFTYSSTPMFQNHAAGSVTATSNGASNTVTTTLPSSGLVPFLFNSTTYSMPNGTAVNGGPIGSNVAIGFLIDPLNDSIAYALFKDIWQGGDADFDDMVVQIKINDPPTTTPLPGTLPLFAIGLGAIGLLGWPRMRKTGATATAKLITTLAVQP